MQVPLKVCKTEIERKKKGIPTSIPEEPEMRCESPQSLESSPSSFVKLQSLAFNYVKVPSKT